MFFSIIVSAYNVEKYVRKCLESIRRQSFRDYEVVIVDDGSKDGTLKICEEYNSIDQRFKVIHKDNGGVVSARKTGASHTKGDYLVTVDGDDEIEENMLQEIYEIIKNEAPDMVAFGYKTVDEEGNIVSERVNDIDTGLYMGEDLKQLKSKCLYDESRRGINGGNLIFSTWSKIIKTVIYKKCIDRVNDNVEKGDDLAALLYILQSVGTIMVADITGYHYRMQKSSITHNYEIEDLRKQSYLRDELYKAIINDQSMLNQVRVCVFYTTYERIQKLVNAETSYDEFMKVINLANRFRLFEEANCIYCKYPSISERVKLTIIKNGWWKILYLYLKMQSKHMKMERV